MIMRAAIALLVVLSLSGCLAAPADLQKLEALKEKLRNLHDVLDELNKNIDSLEGADDKREFASTPAPVDEPDEETENFIHSLSPEDAKLVESLKSKLGYLQATVHEAPGVDIPAEDGFSEEQPAEEPAEEKRAMEPELENLYEHMAEDDKEMLREHPSMWEHLSKALRTPGGNPADVVANAKREKTELVKELSDDDQELLRKMRSKLGNLKTALRSQKSPVDEVQQRLLNDVRYAKENGVSLKDVLRVLIDAKKEA